MQEGRPSLLSRVLSNARLTDPETQGILLLREWDPPRQMQTACGCGDTERSPGAEAVHPIHVDESTGRAVGDSCQHAAVGRGWTAAEGHSEEKQAETDG